MSGRGRRSFAHPPAFPMPNNDASKQQIRRRDATVDTQYTHRAENKTDSSEIHGNAIRANKKRREWKLNTEKFVALPLFF